MPSYRPWRPLRISFNEERRQAVNGSGLKEDTSDDIARSWDLHADGRWRQSMGGLACEILNTEKVIQ